MFKSKRRKELERKERELNILKLAIDELKVWCAADSPEIGFAMLHLEKLGTHPEGVDSFRRKLRSGQFTFEKFKE